MVSFLWLVLRGRCEIIQQWCEIAEIVSSLVSNPFQKKIQVKLKYIQVKQIYIEYETCKKAF